jgi:photosystem II stability/assembly factor-like uncharacterized protein
MKKWILLFLFACQQEPLKISTEPLVSSTNATLQAISILNGQVAWISGHQATFMRTLDGGKTWDQYHHQSDTLQFRDLHAFSSEKVILMSAGTGKASRINMFTVPDQWEETYVMPHEEGFLNTIEFWNHETGLAFGDSFNGELFILKTTDGGRSWTRIDPANLPPAGDGEGGFAASGTCISTLPGGKAWIGTGAGGNARLLITSDFGETWEVLETPMPKGDMAGTFSTRMATSDNGTLSGGDLGNENPAEHLVYTKDGGKNWKFANAPITSGTFYGSDLETIDGRSLWIICGPNGMDYSTDMGTNWVNLDTANYWAVEVDPSGNGYAVGADGRIVRIIKE